jgi:hypothetical protein
METCEALTRKHYKCRNGSKYCMNLDGKMVNFCGNHKKYIDDLQDYYYDPKKGKLVVNRIARVPHDKDTGLPSRYVEGLTKAQKLRYKTEIDTTKEYYKRTGLVKGRKSVFNPKNPNSPQRKRSSHVIEFERRYGFKITDTDHVLHMFPDTDIDGILRKGRAAYMSGSRPTVSGSGGPTQWALARAAAVLTCSPKALAVDKDLVGPKSMKIICGNKK